MYTKIQKPDNVSWVYIHRLNDRALSIVRKMSDDQISYFKIFDNAFISVETATGEVRISDIGSSRTLLQHAKTFEFNLNK
jgi:hypothetical protein